MLKDYDGEKSYNSLGFFENVKNARLIIDSIFESVSKYFPCERYINGDLKVEKSPIYIDTYFIIRLDIPNEQNS